MFRTVWIASYIFVLTMTVTARCRTSQSVASYFTYDLNLKKRGVRVIDLTFQILSGLMTGGSETGSFSCGNTVQQFM